MTASLAALVYERLTTRPLVPPLLWPPRSFSALERILDCYDDLPNPPAPPGEPYPWWSWETHYTPGWGDLYEVKFTIAWNFLDVPFFHKHVYLIHLERFRASHPGADPGRAAAPPYWPAVLLDDGEAIYPADDLEHRTPPIEWPSPGEPLWGESGWAYRYAIGWGQAYFHEDCPQTYGNITFYRQRDEDGEIERCAGCGAERSPIGLVRSPPAEIPRRRAL